MAICLLGFDWISTAAFLYCIRILIRGSSEKISFRFVIHCSVLCTIYIPLDYIRGSHPVLCFVIQLVMLFFHIKLYYRDKILFAFSSAFCVYVFWELSHLITGLLMFPYIYFFDVKLNTVMSDAIFICIQVLLYFLTVCFFRNKKWGFMRGISKIMRFGIVFICMGLEMVILLLRSLTYDSEDEIGRAHV